MKRNAYSGTNYNLLFQVKATDLPSDYADETSNVLGLPRPKEKQKRKKNANKRKK